MLLAVDTSTQWMGLALYDGAQVIAEVVWRTRNHHTVELTPAVKSLFKQTGITAEDLKALGVAIGPGSFTSLRIGLAMIKGLSLALHLPLVGIPTLDVVAAGIPARELPLIAVIQAGRNRLAAGRYEAVSTSWKSVDSPRVVNAEELSASIREPTIICGELTGEERQLLARKRKNVVLSPPAQCVRRPSLLAELAWQRWHRGQVDDPASLGPIYLHIAEGLPV